MNPDKCCWPHCRNARDCLYLDKPLCDKHCELVQAEDTNAGNRARKKIGLPPFPTVSRTKDPVPAPPPLPPTSGEDAIDFSGLEDRFESGQFDLDDADQVKGSDNGYN